MNKYCVCADRDSGLIPRVQLLDVAVNKVPFGWIILPNTTTPHLPEAEKQLRWWARRPKKIQAVIDSKTMM